MHHPATGDRGRPRVSIITPAYNEEECLPLLFDALVQALSGQPIDWEWVVVDDHSIDGTFQYMQALAAKHDNIRAVRLAQNRGSHLALHCGLLQARGDCAVIIAADGQTPPQLVAPLIERWQRGSEVVWLTRRSRPDDSWRERSFAWLFYWIMRNYVGLRNFPRSGSDACLVDRTVVDALRHHGEHNLSLFMLIASLGFKQTEYPFERPARQRGQSRWTLRRKLKLVVDSVIGFSDRSVKTLTRFGFLLAALGLICAGGVGIHALRGNAVDVWSALLCAIVILGGAQMIALSLLGGYLWRTANEGRGRPAYQIEQTAGQQHSSNPTSRLTALQV